MIFFKGQVQPKMRILSLSTHPHAWEFMGGFWVYLSIRMRVSDDWIFLNMHTCVNIISNRQVVEHSSTVRYKSEELIFFFFSHAAFCFYSMTFSELHTYLTAFVQITLQIKHKLCQVSTILCQLFLNSFSFSHLRFCHFNHFYFLYNYQALAAGLKKQASRRCHFGQNQTINKLREKIISRLIDHEMNNQLQSNK